MDLFVWGLEVCANLVVGGVCVAEVCGGGLRCWGLCVFVIKSLCRLWVFCVVVRLDRLDSGTKHTFHIFSFFTLQKTIRCNSTSNAPDGGHMYPKNVELRIC